MGYRRTSLSCSLGLLLAVVSAPCSGTEGSHHFHIEIDKSEKQLQVMRAHEVVQTFPIVYGQGGSGPKLKMGDSKTPEGEYRIADINPSSRFTLFFLLDYPNPIDVERALSKQVIQPRHYSRLKAAHTQGYTPPQYTPLGGWIGIHGLGFASNARKRDQQRQRNWTEGCIALTNREIRELRRYIKIGTPVTIRR